MPKKSGAVTGGERVRAWARKAQRAASKPPTVVEVGYFPESRYRDRNKTPVALVGAMHEYGLGDLPERAFLRRSVPESAPAVRKAIRERTRGQSLDHPLALTPKTAQRAGEIVADRIRENIDALQDPPLDPETVERKGSRDLLRDTDRLRDSVEVRVSDGTARPVRRAG